MKKPTQEKIRKLCTPESFGRGVDYLREGRVRELEVSGSVASALVKGTRNYRIEVSLDRGLSAKCTCPYDFDGYCKHIVAALLVLSGDFEGLVKKGEVEKDMIDSVLKEMNAEQLRDFLKRETSRDVRLRSHLLISATGELKQGGRSVSQYKKDVSRLYEASDDGFIGYGSEVEFDEFVDLARRFAEKGNFTEAAMVYQALSEVIAENMDSVDDSDGYYGDRFWEAIRGLSSCTNSLAHEEKGGYIDYLFEKFTKGEPDYFQDAYDEALRSVCIGSDGLQHLKRLLVPILPGSLPEAKKDWSAYYRSAVLLEMQAFALDGLATLGDEESRRGLYDLLRRYYLNDDEFCLLYAMRLEKDGDVSEAIKVAEKGVRTFPAHLSKGLRLFLNGRYESLSPEKYMESLKTLFFEEQDWSYYEKLRKLSGDSWDSILHEMLNHFSSRDERRYNDETILIEIYLREKIFDAALNEVIARRDLRVLSRYYKQLADRYPKEYFKMYKELLLPYADSSGGRGRYSEVASQLKKMKRIRGFESEFKKYVRMLRLRYARRPAFLDEMKGL